MKKLFTIPSLAFILLATTSSALASDFSDEEQDQCQKIYGISCEQAQDVMIIEYETTHASAPSCTGVVASPTQRAAYTKTLSRTWPKKQQLEYLRNHENHLGTRELANWNLLYDEERMAIIQYTEGSFSEINPQLRSGHLKMTSLFTAICSGLNKLPDHQGWVYRILDLTPDQINDIKTKRTYSDLAFMSTAVDQVLVWKRNTLLKILTQHGKNLLGITAHTEEEEVLLLPGTPFKVVDFKENPPTSKYLYEITLEEVNSLDN